jgi:hypothetical protein
MLVECKPNNRPLNSFYARIGARTDKSQELSAQHIEVLIDLFGFAATKAHGSLVHIVKFGKQLVQLQQRLYSLIR